MQVFFSLACVVSLVSVGLRAHTFVQGLRQEKKKGARLGMPDFREKHRVKHLEALKNTNTELRLICVSMAVGIAEVRWKSDSA